MRCAGGTAGNAVAGANAAPRGSAREMLACLELAEAFGYVAELDAKTRDSLERIAATLVRLVERPG